MLVCYILSLVSGKGEGEGSTRRGNGTKQLQTCLCLFISDCLFPWQQVLLQRMKEAENFKEWEDQEDKVH